MLILNTLFKTFITFFILLLVTVIQLHAQDTYLKFDHLTVNNGLPQNSVYSIIKDKYGFVWFGTWGGAVRYDGYTTKVFRAGENDTTALPDNRINIIVTDSLQNVWIETGDSTYLYKYNYEYENFTRYIHSRAPNFVKKLLGGRKIKRIIEASNARYVWVSDYRTLQQTNRSSGTLLTYLADLNNPFSISDNVINAMYVDNNENLWIGTQNGGINHANLNIKPFSYYFADKNGNGLIQNLVRAVCMDREGRIWVGSENKGITIIERSVHGNDYKYVSKEQPIYLSIRFLYCDSKGLVWIGTKRGLKRYNPNTKTFKDCSAGICNPNVFSILEDYKGDFWIGTFNGIARYNRISEQFECFPSSTTGGRQIRSIIEDRQHNLWVATEDSGLTKLVRTSSKNLQSKFKTIRYAHCFGNDNTLISNRTYSLAEDKNGMIWIATNSGLSRLNPQNNTFKNFTIRNGLSDDITMGVLFDGKESVWVSHKKGLSRININTFELRNFNILDGLQGYEFNQNTCFRDTTTGEMFFGGTNGLNSFYPDSIKINHHKPRIVLTQLSVMQQIVLPGQKINNRVVLEKSLLCTNEIVLSWWNKTFRLEFAALDFANPLGNKYKYKLEGYDKQWIYTDASMRVASYSNLSSGTYVFKVFAANSDGVWCDSPATLQIKVLPPWWFTWWAITFYAIIGCFVVWFIYKYVVSRIEFRKNEEIHEAKLKFFTEVSHEFRTPLTLIIDPSEKIINENLSGESVKEYGRLINRNAKQLLSLVNQVLDFRKLEAGHLSLNLQTSDIITFVRSIAASFVNLAANRHIQLEVHSFAEQLTMPFDDSKLTIVLNNLLANAFKYTPDFGKIDIFIESSNIENNGVTIKVADNGTGIAKEEHAKIFDIFYQSTNTPYLQGGSGIGLALTKELVQLHGGKISVESETAKGACFTVFLPFPEEKRNGVSNTSDYTLNIRPEGSVINGVQPNSSPKELPIMLVVDDNSDILHYISLTFNANFHIIIAANGSDGFLKATDTIPDIIISDIMMPGMNGIELCQKLKTDERTSHIPVILLTARQSDESQIEGYETGADAYIVKPFSTALLRVRIKNLLESRKKLRQLFDKSTGFNTSLVTTNLADQAFISKVTSLIEANMSEENFDVEWLADKLSLSRIQLYRKIKALTNQSAYEFVTTIRLNKASVLLLENQLSVGEIAFRVGYTESTSFSRIFQKQFGLTPKKFSQQNKNDLP